MTRSTVLGSNSQAHQESFVLTTLDFKRNGFYLELGSAWPIRNSNTYLLETQYEWSGLSIENDPERVELFNSSSRKNKCVQADGVTFDYAAYFAANGFPPQLDYLQMDLHPASVTLDALINLPLDRYRFSTITYEHNGYRDPPHQEIKRRSQEILLSQGYLLVAEDLTLKFQGMDRAYEVWYVDPSSVPASGYHDIFSKGAYDTDLFSPTQPPSSKN